MPLSVLGASLAKPGLVFLYQGETDSGCGACKLRSVCHGSLKVGREYRVKAARPVMHDVCHVFEGKVQIVEIEEKPLPVRIAIPVAATRGTGYSKNFEECGAACLLKKHCNAPALVPGVTAKIEKVEGDVPCVVGRKLKFALVSPG